jgi:MHS family proline/betaine transporter-like MFS transporter
MSLRFLQGVCTGGEYNGSFIFAFEHRQERQGYLGGLITAASTSGMVFAIISSLMVTHFFKSEIAWRIPFIIGGIIALLGYGLRRYIIESPEFIDFSRTQKIDNRYKFFNLLQNSFTAFGMIFFIGATSGGLFYFQFIYLNGYCTKALGMDGTSVTVINTFAMILYVMFLPLFGHLSDVYGHYKTIFLASIMTCILIIPMYLIIAEGTIWHLAFAQVVISGCIACFVAPSHIIMKNAFPVNVRYVAVSLSYCLGMCLLGGTTPLICTWLSQNAPLSLSPGFYIITLCFVAAMFIRKYCEKNNKDIHGSSKESHHKESLNKAA